jgi:hypothetical protein
MVRQQAQQQSAADKFALAMSKVKDTFMRMVDGGFLDKFADMIIEIATRFSAGGISGVFFGLSAKQELDAATEQVRNLKKSYGQQTGVTVGSLEDAKKLQEDGKLTQEQVNELDKAIKKRESFKSQAELERRRNAQTSTSGGGISGGSGYAGMAAEPVDDFIIRPGQPALKFRKDDIIAGGTNLLGGGDSTKIDRMISLLEQLVNTKGSVYIDGARVGDALVMGTYRSV